MRLFSIHIQSTDCFATRRFGNEASIDDWHSGSRHDSAIWRRGISIHHIYNGYHIQRIVLLTKLITTWIWYNKAKRKFAVPKAASTASTASTACREGESTLQGRKKKGTHRHWHRHRYWHWHPHQHQHRLRHPYWHLQRHPQHHHLLVPRSDSRAIAIKKALLHPRHRRQQRHRHRHQHQRHCHQYQHRRI